MNDREKYFWDMVNLAANQWEQYNKNLTVSFGRKHFSDVIKKIDQILSDDIASLNYCSLFYLYDVSKDEVIDDKLYLHKEAKDWIAERNRFFKNLYDSFRGFGDCQMVRIVFDLGIGGYCPCEHYVVTTKHASLMDKDERIACLSRGISTTLRNGFKKAEAKPMSFSDYWKILSALASKKNYIKRKNPMVSKSFDESILKKIYDSLE